MIAPAEQFSEERAFRTEATVLCGLATFIRAINEADPQLVEAARLTLSTADPRAPIASKGQVNVNCRTLRFGNEACQKAAIPVYVNELPDALLSPWRKALIQWLVK